MTDQPINQLVAIILIAYSVFTVIILLVFVPTSSIISDTGYTTSDLQQATNPEEVEVILGTWEGVLSTVYFQYLGDFIFLFSGLLGNTAIFVLLGKKIKEYGSVLLPFVGFFMVFLSRGADALENTLTMLIIAFPDNYPQLILSILPVVPIVKFTFVGIVYSLIIINLFYYILLRWNKTV
ncbi:MAG: hypothetical protein ACXABU_14475 [Candidatus Hodarchaeales archaeon]